MFRARSTERTVPLSSLACIPVSTSRQPDSTAGISKIRTRSGLLNAERLGRTAKQGRRAVSHPLGTLFVGVGQLQDGQVGLRRAHDLQAHGQAGRAETPRDAHGRDAGEGSAYHHFHPAVIAVHFAPGYGFWPVQRCIEREHLRTGQ
ncbi:hypothetical protein D9M71_642600 [compost metagenome]